MKKTKKWDDKSLAHAIKQSVGTDGYARSTVAGMTVTVMARRRWGSWPAACLAAGVRASGDRPQYGVCTADGCGRATRSPTNPYCEMHYYRLRRTGTTDARVPTRQERTVTSNGYYKTYDPGHPLSSADGCVYEHRKVYHASGRDLVCHVCGTQHTWLTCHIDHLDNDKSNNDIENLAPACPLCNIQRTKKKTKGSFIEFNGKRQNQAQWAKELGISTAALVWRIRSWGVERALSEPVRRNKRRKAAETNKQILSTTPKLGIVSGPSC